VQDEGLTCATGGLAGRLPPEVATGLGAISRVARALNAPGSLDELAGRALAEMRSALDLSATVLYLPDAGGRPVLRHYLEDVDAGIAAQRELVFDEEAWALAVAGGRPLVFQETASFLVGNPFTPDARFWLVLPLVAAGDLLGVVIASRAVPVDLDATTLTVLTLLGDQLSAGIATARLRQELQQSELERERMRLAAEVHDGLAQDLALAMRELALLDSGPPPEIAQASQERLREAVSAAHRLVRARLVDLYTTPPLGGWRAAVGDVCDRFARRGVPVYLDAPDETPNTDPAGTAVALRVLSEALTNAEKHAQATRIAVALAERDAGWLELRVHDNGQGFDPTTAGGNGHLGLELMRRRAEDAGGTLQVESARGEGTTVTLRLMMR
jgi:signal transduction histidine kinase